MIFTIIWSLGTILSYYACRMIIKKNLLMKEYGIGWNYSSMLTILALSLTFSWVLFCTALISYVVDILLEKDKDGTKPPKWL